MVGDTPMEAKAFTVIGVWVFVTIWLIGSFLVGADMLIALMLFLVAVVVSVGLSLMPKPRPNPLA